MFSKVLNQSNPIFGKLVFRTDREMTKKMTEKAFEEKAACMTVLSKIRTEWEA